MAQNVLLFESSSGEQPVENFIKAKEPQAQAKMIHVINLLEKYGPQLGMPHSKKLTPELYELRIRGKNEIRIIYCFKKTAIYLLHAFKKQTQKTPRREIETSLKRFALK